MKEKIKAFIKENWIAITITTLLIAITLCMGCGSTWKISGNKINVLNEKIEKFYEDSTKEQMGEISQKAMEPRIENTERVIQ